MATREKSNMLIVISVIWKNRPDPIGYTDTVKILEGTLRRRQVYCAVQALKERRVINVLTEDGKRYLQLKKHQEEKAEELLIEADLL